MTSDPLEILDAIDRERGESLIGMIQANQVQRLRDEIAKNAMFEERVAALETRVAMHSMVLAQVRRILRPIADKVRERRNRH